MTRPMHQDAATAVLRRTIMVPLLLLLMICLSSFPSVTAECPDKCMCREEVYVHCIDKRLDRIPDRLHPATKELDLSSNEIRDIKPLAHLTELEYLDLSSNKISDIEPLAHLTELRILGLDNNTIRDIESLAQLTALRRLHLSSNEIRDIKPLAHLRELTRLMLDNNPLTCDCNNLLFVNVVKKSYPQQDVLRYSNPSCHFPLDMREKWLKEITENDFNCTSPDVIVVPENKTVSVGEQLQLSCKAVGDPEPSITWTKDDIDLELGQRVQVFQNNTLMISKVERTDGGQYKCVAFNSFGRKSFEAMVIVNGADI